MLGVNLISTQIDVLPNRQDFRQTTVHQMWVVLKGLWVALVLLKFDNVLEISWWGYKNLYNYMEYWIDCEKNIKMDKN
jgi:hypothetical protein